MTVDPIVISWLQGELRMDPQLMGLGQVVEPHPPLAGWPVSATVHAIHRVVERGASARVLLIGPPSSGRRTFAAAVAQHFGIMTLAVDTSEITDADWNDSFMRAQRLAVMGNSALVWHGSRLHRSWPGHVAPAPIQFVAADVDQSVPPCEHLIDQRVEMPSPTVDERRGIWRAAIPESAAWPADELETLVTRYRLHAGDIARWRAGRRPVPVRRPISPVSSRVTGSASSASCWTARSRWDDLVLPDRLREALEDFAFEARDRVRFWEGPAARRLFPRGTGLVALFSGPPGTGKTMAAQVVAAELELDLFRVDLASVVSKYIGETAKHLARDLRPRRAHERRPAVRRGRCAVQQAHRGQRRARPLRQCRHQLPAAAARGLPRHRHCSRPTRSRTSTRRSSVGCATCSTFRGPTSPSGAGSGAR